MDGRAVSSIWSPGTRPVTSSPRRTPGRTGVGPFSTGRRISRCAGWRARRLSASQRTRSPTPPSAGRRSPRACGSKDIPTPRDGSGVACEVYPGAALAAWGFGAQRYKKAAGALVRGELVEALSARWPWPDWAGHQDVCAASDDALDAVIAAVVAREVLLGRAISPRAELAAAADEGWIWSPTPN
ncbi:DUF429 domain-containing protein [Brachybacterium sp. GPGPB12]|uniref:DUF429 domain-containing protein n=1 Tax=Brachybacterium sp. GPGPB12 TaxID=3023517 RepID=UPI0031346229